MRSSRAPHAAKLAAAIAVAVLLAGCGGSDAADSDDPTGTADSSSAAGSPSATSDPTQALATDPTDEPSKGGKGDKGGQGDHGKGSQGDPGGSSVARAPFCDSIDPSAVAEELGLDEAEVLVEVQPGDEIQADPATPGVASKEWTCTIGESGGSSVAATWTIRDGHAGSNDPRARMKTLQGTLGAKNCEDVDDEALGEGTQGVDCSGAATNSTAIGFTLAARAIVVDGTQLECYLASTDPADLTDLAETAPDICPMVLDVAVG